MNESAKFEVQKKKLQGLCDEHNLVYRFRKDKYPITLTFQTTGDISGQMSMLEMAEEDGYRSPDATLVFTIKDGELDIKISETFTISEALLGKLKTVFKKMHSYWLQFFFRDLMERQALDEKQMPVIDDEDGEDDGAGIGEDFDEMKDAMENLGADEEDDGEEDGDYEYTEPGNSDEA